MSKGRSDFRPPEELDELSPQLRELDRYLLLDGAAWRRRLPDADQATRRAVALLEQPRLPTTDPSTLSTEILPAQHAPTSYPAPSAQPDRRRPSSRTQRLVAVAAAIAIVGLLAALLHSVVPGRQGTTAHTPTPRVTAPASPTQPTATTSVSGAWSALPGFAGKHGIAYVGSNLAYAYTQQTRRPRHRSSVRRQPIPSSAPPTTARHGRTSPCPSLSRNPASRATIPSLTSSWDRPTRTWLRAISTSPSNWALPRCVSPMGLASARVLAIARFSSLASTEARPGSTCNYQRSLRMSAAILC